MIEVRDAGAHHWEATGLATTWSSSSKPYFIASREGMFLEQIARNAFEDATGGREHVELRLEHKLDGPVLARTDHGTLRYVDEDRGLLQVALLSKADRAAVEAVAKINSNAYGGLSVGMIVHDDHWGKASDGVTQLRTITRASLTEVSIVHRPANPHAQVLSVRQENRSATGEVIEYRSFFEQETRAAAHEKYTPEQIVADAELRASTARSRATEARAEVLIARYRAAHPITETEMAAIHRRSMELETEALAAITKTRSLL